MFADRQYFKNLHEIWTLSPQRSSCCRYACSWTNLKEKKMIQRLKGKLYLDQSVVRASTQREPKLLRHTSSGQWLKRTPTRTTAWNFEKMNGNSGHFSFRSWMLHHCCLDVAPLLGRGRQGELIKDNFQLQLADGTFPGSQVCLNFWQRSSCIILSNSTDLD